MIALVVTIIVLLILAGVAINLTIGQNGIFTRAQNATAKYEQAGINEQEEMNSVVDLIDNLNQKTIVQAFKDGEIKMGDYVDYQNPKTGEYTSPAGRNGTADQNFTVDETTQWRVLGLSEDGNNLLLVAADPIKRGEVANPNTGNGYSNSDVEDMQTDYYYYLYGAEGAYYTTDNAEGEGELDRICSIYKNDLADEVRSMKTEDINNLLNLTVKYDNPNAGVYKKDDTSYSRNFDEMGALGETYTYQEGDQTPASNLGKEQINAGHIEKGTAYYYSYGNESSPNSEIGVDSTMYEMLFKGTENYDNKPYWLASSGVQVYSSGANFGPGAANGGNVDCGYSVLFDSDGYGLDNGMGVLPVVSLKSGVKVNQIKVISGSRGENWPPHGLGGGEPN